MFEKIKFYLDSIGEKNQTFDRVIDAIFNQKVSSFDDMIYLKKDLRENLKQNVSLTELFLVESHRSGNTVKFVLKTNDSQFIESVLIEHGDGRRTVCVSSQVFCALGCTFCATGANSFKRNLTTQEIIEQVLFVSRYLNHEDKRVTNVVYMGMGEPFLNYKVIEESIRILNNKKYFNIGARHITVSTSGIVPSIEKYADFELQSRLAISLHAPNDELRTRLMPINKRYSLKDLMCACDLFTKKTNKRISYEYVLIKNINDSLKEAKELVNLLKDRLAHINLLIYNPHEFSKFEKPDIEKVRKFKKYLEDAGLEVSIRKSMGDDISGACGQLSGKIHKATKEEVETAVMNA